MILSRWCYLGLIVLLGSDVAQAMLASPQHRVTFDEQYHLTPGYVHLTQRDLRFHHDQNPPLFEAILAAPLSARSDLHLYPENAEVAREDRALIVGNGGEQAVMSNE